MEKPILIDQIGVVFVLSIILIAGAYLFSVLKDYGDPVTRSLIQYTVDPDHHRPNSVFGLGEEITLYSEYSKARACGTPELRRFIVDEYNQAFPIKVKLGEGNSIGGVYQIHNTWLKEGHTLLTGCYGMYSHLEFNCGVLEPNHKETFGPINFCVVHKQ